MDVSSLATLVGEARLLRSPCFVWDEAEAETETEAETEVEVEAEAD